MPDETDSDIGGDEDLLPEREVRAGRVMTGGYDPPLRILTRDRADDYPHLKAMALFTDMMTSLKY
jgi:hypothetical protein